MSYLVDTSVWVEFFRTTDSPASRQLADLVRIQPQSIRGCSVVRLELALDPHDLRRRRVLKAYDTFETVGVIEDDFAEAARIYRAVRTMGHTPRGVNDCLIAAAALRDGATIVHRDIDLDRIADAVSDLSVLRVADR